MLCSPKSIAFLKLPFYAKEILRKRTRKFGTLFSVNLIHDMWKNLFVSFYNKIKICLQALIDFGINHISGNIFQCLLMKIVHPSFGIGYTAVFLCKIHQPGWP